MTFFVVFDAMIFHGVVAARYPNIVEEVNAQTKNGRRNFLIENWDKILEIDFQPIFGLARDLLDVIPNTPAWNDRLDSLAKVAGQVHGSGVLAKHDFMGRLFHKILLSTTGEAYATYYTAIPSAYLLARVAVCLHEARFSDISSTNCYIVGDLACGSGTLLSAVYTAVRDRYVAESKTPLDLDKFHAQLVKECLYGLDVLDYAAHLTLTTLALHNTKAEIDSSNVFTVPVGVRDDVPYLGSLDLYFDRLTGLSFDQREVGKSISGAGRSKGIDLPEFDLLIMNPPFSRSSGSKVSFAYETPEHKPKLRARMRQIARNQGFRKILVAGMGSLFVPLAIKHARAGGRIAFVLPRALLSGVSWQEVRDHVLRHCHLEIVFSNHDPGYMPVSNDGKAAMSGTPGWAFSEETNIAEVMFIARKRHLNYEEDREQTRFVNIFEFPSNEYEAIAMANQIITNERTNGEGDLLFNSRVVGNTFLIPQNHLRQNNWLFPCLFASRDLDDLVMTLMKQRSLVPFSRLATSYGCDISAEKGMFTRSSVRTAFPVLWTHGISQNRLLLDWSQVEFGSPKKDRTRAANFFQEKSGSLLIAERPHLKTTPTFAIVSKRNILATPFWECRLKDEDSKQVIAMWLNSTYGIILMLAAATNSRGEIFKLKRDQLEKMLVLNPDIIDRQAASAMWSNICCSTLDNVEKSWQDAAKGLGIRYQLDQFFGQHIQRKLGPADYDLLASEPIVTHRRR